MEKEKILDNNGKIEPENNRLETGLENWTDEELIEAASKYILRDLTSFSFLREDVMEEMAKNEKTKSFFDILKKQLFQADIIDLGSGPAKIEKHAEILRKFFYIRSYIAVDTHKAEPVFNDKNDQFVQADVLEFLSKQQDESATLMALGLLDEPLMSYTSSGGNLKATNIQKEYIRRLSEHIYRITPKGGIFFGNDIFPAARLYLLKAGFVEASHEEIEAIKRPYFNYPFVFHKRKNNTESVKSNQGK